MFSIFDIVNSTISSTAVTVPWGLSYENFLLLPSDQAGNCDVFGPLCQTGTATISLNIREATTTSVVPCSSYLAAQSSWISLHLTDGERDLGGASKSSWISSFGRSPECTAFARAVYSDHVLLESARPSLTGCPSNDSGVLGPFQNYLPPALESSGYGRYWLCCGGCTLNVPALRLLYFPDPSLSCDQLNSTNSTITTRASLDSNPPVTAVLSGYTLYIAAFSIMYANTNTCTVLHPRCTCKFSVQRTSQTTVAPSVRNTPACSFHYHQELCPRIHGTCL